MATSPITKPLQNVETKHIRIIGVPLDLGQSRRGVDMGPSAMRVAGLEIKLEALGYDVEDGGNVPVALAETEAEGDPNAKYLGDHRNLLERSRAGSENPGSRKDPHGSWWRPFYCCRNSFSRGRILSPQEPAHRPSVD